MGDAAPGSPADLRRRLRYWFACYGVSVGIHVALLFALTLFVIHEVYWTQIDAMIGEIEAGDGEFGFAELDLPSLDAQPEAAPVFQTGDLRMPTSNPLEALAKSSGNSAAQGSVGFFGTRARGRTFAFVVDLSGSMNGMIEAEEGALSQNRTRVSRREAAVEELSRALGQLSSWQHFYVIFYDDEPYPMFHPDPCREFLAGTKANRERVLDWVATLPSGGGTRPQEALRMALQMRPDVVFFLTDGEIPDGTQGFARHHNGGDAVIHTIGIGKERDPVLEAVAFENHGQYSGVTTLKLENASDAGDPAAVRVVVLSCVSDQRTLGGRLFELRRELRKLPTPLAAHLNDPLRSHDTVYLLTHNAFSSVTEYANELQLLLRATADPAGSHGGQWLLDGRLGHPWLPHRMRRDIDDESLVVLQSSRSTVAQFLRETSNSIIGSRPYFIDQVVLFGDKDACGVVENTLDVAAVYNRLDFSVADGRSFLKTFEYLPEPEPEPAIPSGAGVNRLAREKPGQ